MSAINGVANGQAGDRSVSHVVFDMDGLLLDTEKHYTLAQDTVCRRYGHQFTWELKQMQMGRKWEDACRMLIERLQLPLTVQQYSEETRIILNDLFPKAQLMPGADRLVRHLHSNNVPIAICTGSQQKTYLIKTSRHKELFSLFGDRVLWISDDPEVKLGKPAPDCYLICAKRFFGGHVNPKDILVFEDSPNGVEAALAAGMPVVMVPDERMEREVSDKATMRLESLDEFKPEWFGLPPYKN